MTASLDCLCAGIVVADFVCQPIAKIPPAGGLTRTDRVEFSIGGCAANVAVDMAKLGINVGISGRVGDDLFGREIYDQLQGMSIDCAGLMKSSTAATSSTFVLNVLGEDRRFIHSVGANAEYNGEHIPPEMIESAKVLYVGGFGLMESLTLERVERMFRIARNANVKTILDVVLPEASDLANSIEAIAPLTDFFFPNNDEAERLTGESNPIHQAQFLRALGISTVIVTCGRNGSVLLGPHDRIVSDVYSVQAVDPTGTGDAFVSGFVYGLLCGDSLSDCLRLGTAMGASCVRSMGATTGVFSSCELRKFVDNTPLPMKRLSN